MPKTNRFNKLAAAKNKYLKKQAQTSGFYIYSWVAGHNRPAAK
jgi:hypothetical protein